MKALVSALTVAILLGGSLAFSQGGGPEPAQGGSDPRVESLTAEVAALKQKNDALATEFEDTKALLEKTLAYLDAQAKHAATLATTLDEVERLGFTYGINPESRQTLLRGWREQLSAAQQDVPSAPAKKAAGKSEAKKKP